MLSYNNISIIGTSHIARQSLHEIKQAFNTLNPDIVAVELDKNRLAGLLSQQTSNLSPVLIKTIGLQGYIFALLGRFIQKKLGNIVNMKPGADMIMAIKIAKEHKKKIALIDRDIQITLRRFSNHFSAKEKTRLFWDIISAPFTKKRIKINLSKVPEKKIINQLLTQLQHRYPNMYKVLVQERNEYMARALLHINQLHPESKILAIVGAGHEEAILSLVKQQPM